MFRHEISSLFATTDGGVQGRRQGKGRVRTRRHPRPVPPSASLRRATYSTVRYERNATHGRLVIIAFPTLLLAVFFHLYCTVLYPTLSRSRPWTDRTAVRYSRVYFYIPPSLPSPSVQYSPSTPPPPGLHAKAVNVAYLEYTILYLMNTCSGY